MPAASGSGTLAPTGPGTARTEPVISVDPATMQARYQAALSLFEYDPTAALDARVIGSSKAAGVMIEEISYVGQLGSRVPAIIVSPTDRIGAPGMIFLYPGHAADLVDRAMGYARLGITVLLIDPPQVRREGGLLRFTPQDREEQIQLMIELQRGVDLLLALEADPDRLAFIGYSWGCVMGAQLAGIERRMKAYVLMFCDGGAVEHFLGPDDANGELAALSQSERAAWIDAMEPIESLYFIGHAAPAALLVQSGLQDEEILREDAERLQHEASEPKDIRWYESGHDPTPDAPEVWCEQAEWLRDQLRLASAAVPECG